MVKAVLQTITEKESILSVFLFHLQAGKRQIRETNIPAELQWAQTKALFIRAISSTHLWKTLSLFTHSTRAPRQIETSHCDQCIHWTSGWHYYAVYTD